MSTAKDQNQAPQDHALPPVVLVTSIMFITISVLYLECYYTARWTAWVVPALFLTYGVATTVYGARLYPVAQFSLGLWTIVTVVCATGLGQYLQSAYLHHYHELDVGGLVSDVNPSVSHPNLEGSTFITFDQDTFVDDRRTVGFVARGRVYCLAPVSSRGRPNSHVSFWAVGMDCCERRSNFDCGTSRTSGQLMAVTYHTRADKYFKAAVGIAMSVYNVTTSDEAAFVGFVEDSDAIKDRIWGRALTLMVAAGLTHFVCSAVVALICRSTWNTQRTPPSKEEAKQRWIVEGCHDCDLDHSALDWDPCCGCLGSRWRFFAPDAMTELIQIEAWERRHQMARDNLTFFDQVFIAEDGGLRQEVKDLVHSQSLSTYIFALITPACMVYNTVYILNTDIFYLRAADMEIDWCITGFAVDTTVQWLMDQAGAQVTIHVPAMIVVAVLELLGMVGKYILLLYLILEAVLTSEVRRKWANVCFIFFDLLPSLSTFSAMQLIGFAVPSLIRFDLVPKLEGLVQADNYLGYIKALLDLGIFIVTRVMVAIAGMDAFLVKFRFTGEFVMANNISIQNLMGSLGFVLQLVGVVDIAYWKRRGIQDFVFAKADGKLSIKEAADKEVWNWMLTERVYRYSNGSLLRFAVSMLTFSDTDFQRLVLNEHGKEAEGLPQTS